MRIGMLHGFGGFGAFGAIAVLGWLFQLLVLAGVVVLIVYLVRSFSRRNYPDHQSPKTTPSADSARHILDERFARGELSAEEYREMKEELQK